MKQQKDHIGEPNKMITAVEWLKNEFYKNGPISEEMPIWLAELFDQAKEMELDQLHKCASFWRGKENEIEKTIFKQYYNENYNK